MTTAWILYVLLVGSLLACAALAMDGLLRRTTLPTRWVWLAALAGIVVFAVLAPREQPAPTRFKVPALEATASRVALPAAGPLGIRAIMTVVRATIATPVSRALAAADARVPTALLLGLGVAWSVLSALVLALLVIVSRRVRLARRDWPRADVQGVPVRIARTIGPAVIGFARPEIVVPRWLLARSAEEQRLVIVHEGEHVAARDQLLLIGGWIVVAMLPWHPAAWWALSRMRLAIELDCDARVLKRGIQPRPYGALLIDIAGQYAGLRVGALALADGTSHLERRLLAMNRSRTRLALVRTALLGAVATLSVAMACEARLPTSAEVDAMNVASLEKTATKAKLLDEAAVKNAIYKVNGEVVSAEQAHALDSKDIATVNVTKSSGENGKGDRVYTYVNIATNKGEAKDGGTPVFFRKRVSEGGVEPGAAAGIEAKRGMMKTRDRFSGLLFVDGVRAPEDALSKLAPSDIVSIDVLKGEAAAKISSDPAAANGIIKVTTKTGATAARP